MNPPGVAAFKEPLLTSRPRMSRAFVKDDAPEAPPLIPPRAALPPGAKNYVTPRGLALLRAERADLEAERTRLHTADEDDGRQRELAVATGRLADLDARLASAVLVEPGAQAPDAVRFGTTVTVRTRVGETPGAERRIAIVGVDEADAAAGRVAFVAPIARAVIGKRVGEATTLRTARGEEVLEIAAITYEAA